MMTNGLGRIMQNRVALIKMEKTWKEKCFEQKVRSQLSICDKFEVAFKAIRSKKMTGTVSVN